LSIPAAAALGPPADASGDDEEKDEEAADQQGRAEGLELLLQSS
jgi:hypothetical protein